jgi:hypothetical protein
VSLLLHDGRRNGHASWLKESIAGGFADGAIFNPFSSPPTSAPSNPSVADVIGQLRGGLPNGATEPTLFFDSATWAATLAGTDLWDDYDLWPLWPHHTRGDLRDAGAIADHVSAVFEVQEGLGVPYLAPTVAVDAVGGPLGRLAIDLAAEGIRQQRSCLITVCGTNSFWRSGPDLDGHVGRLARMRPVGCYVIPMRDRAGYPADLTDTDATAGWLRTIHSLAMRSRVIAAYTDHLGIIAAAAGAYTVGTGWDQGQRVCNPESFRSGSGGGGSVNYSPHPGLLARFNVTIALGLADLATVFAQTMRGGYSIPSDMREHREQHFRAIREQFDLVNSAGPTHAGKYAEVRQMLSGADASWNQAIALGAEGVSRREKAAWLVGLNNGFEAYVRAER